MGGEERESRVGHGSKTPGRDLCKSWINLFRDLQCISCEEVKSEIHSISSVCIALEYVCVCVCQWVGGCEGEAYSCVCR